jgi:hypothetical protein
MKEVHLKLAALRKAIEMAEEIWEENQNP